MRVKFLETYTVKAADGPTYEEGKVYDLEQASARHFVVRNVAQYHNETIELVKHDPEPDSSSVESVQEYEFEKPARATKKGKL